MKPGWLGEKERKDQEQEDKREKEEENEEEDSFDESDDEPLANLYQPGKSWRCVDQCIIVFNSRKIDSS